MLRRWLFTKSQETYGQEDPHFVKVLFEQVSQDVSSGRLFVKPGRRDVLKQMVEDNEQLKFVKTARKMPTYSGIKFPACQSDYPEEDSSVVVTVDLNRIIIQELDADGEPSVRGRQSGGRTPLSPGIAVGTGALADVWEVILVGRRLRLVHPASPHTSPRCPVSDRCGRRDGVYDGRDCKGAQEGR